jgi:hypothetical protein
MGRAKDIKVKVIPSKIANDFVKKHHYSGKVVPNSNLHFGAFLDGQLHGVMSYGCSMDKRKTISLVESTGWNEILELNRMAFDDCLPKNSESRCISISLKLLKKNAPQIKWVISFADGCQCGDGTIYRASGFCLTGVKQNKTILRMPDGSVVADKTLNNSNFKKIGQSAGYWKKKGAKPLRGYQLRYIYFLDPTYKDKLTCPILPFSKIDEMNARMYKGVKQSPRSIDSDATGSQPVDGGANPTLGLLSGGKDAI